MLANQLRRINLVVSGEEMVTRKGNRKTRIRSNKHQPKLSPVSGPWFPSNPAAKKLIPVAMADNRVKVTVRACFTATKYTRKQILWCRVLLCNVSKQQVARSIQRGHLHALFKASEHAAPLSGSLN